MWRRCSQAAAFASAAAVPPTPPYQSVTVKVSLYGDQVLMDIQDDTATEPMQLLHLDLSTTSLAVNVVSFGLLSECATCRIVVSSPQVHGHCS